MKCFFLIFTLNLAFCSLSAQDFLPTVYPDRIVLTLAGDPAREIGVNWRTDTSVTKGYIEFLQAPDGPDMESGTKLVSVSPVRVDVKDVSAHCFNHTLTGLRPSSTYAYRVGSEGTWSEWFHFITADADEADEFTFVYMGDVQEGTKSKWSRVVRQAFKAASDARFFLYTGDIINRSFLNNEWGEWHHGVGFIHSMVPLIASPGNHEYTKSKIDDEKDLRHLCPYWKAGFSFPRNGVAELEETVYFVDFQGTRLISLDSHILLREERFRQAQHEWLESVLKDCDSKWKVVFIHHPLYSSARRDNETLKALFEPLFKKYGVHLVLQGHDHTYARGRVPMDNTAPTYVVSVSGPKMYKERNDMAWAEKTATNMQLYQLITIKRDNLIYRSYTAVGKLVDEFVINK